jgi:hypothetical protein
MPQPLRKESCPVVVYSRPLEVRERLKFAGESADQFVSYLLVQNSPGTPPKPRQINYFRIRRHVFTSDCNYINM